jgi:hypothetical protein
LALDFIRSEPISRRSEGNAVYAAAYQARTQLVDERTGKKSRDYTDQGTLEHNQLVPPAGASEVFHDMQSAWSLHESSERRKDSVVARLYVAALPNSDQASKEERIELALAFGQTYFSPLGLLWQMSLHTRHENDKLSIENSHVHYLVGTRKVEGDRLSRLKMTTLDPTFRSIKGRGAVVEAEEWRHRWRDFQDQWFEAHGKPFRVEINAPIPQRHIGPKRHRHPKDPRIQQNLIRRENNRMLGHDYTRDHAHNENESVSPHKDTGTMESSSGVYPGDGAGREQQQQAIEGLSDKELVRALEIAARGPSREVDLDQVRRELREESRQGGDRGSRTETRGAFHQRYQTERDDAYQARKEAVQEVHDRFAAYQAQARGFFSLRHEQEKLGARKGSERHDAHELVKAQQRGDRVEIQKQRSQQLAAARSAHPVLTWESFVRREAQLGNEVAKDVLSRLQEREQSNSLER